MHHNIQKIARGFVWLAAAVMIVGMGLRWIALPESSGLEIEITTKVEVLERLGPPRLVRRQFDGDLYTWRRTRSRRRSLTLIPIYVRAFHYSDGESHRDDLSLLFDREGILRGVGYRLETQEGS